MPSTRWQIELYLDRSSTSKNLDDKSMKSKMAALQKLYISRWGETQITSQFDNF